MDLTIVIVNWNGGELLQRCLQSIRASRTSFPVKVIVVDNNSRDGSREQAQRNFPEFHVFNSGANLGFGRANNLARPMVDTALVLFLNPDTELQDDTLEQAAQCLGDHPDVGVLGCKMRYPDGRVQEQARQHFPSPWSEFLQMAFLSAGSPRRFGRSLPYLDPTQSGYVRKLYGGCLLCRRDALERIGWFDERYFMYAEDVDLCRSIADAGWRLYYLSSAEIVHVTGGVTRKAPSGFAVLMKCESIGKLMHKYYGWSGLVGYRLAVLAASTFRLCVSIAVGLVSWTRWAPQGFSFGEAFRKQWLVTLWALGLRRARIAS